MYIKRFKNMLSNLFMKMSFHCKYNFYYICKILVVWDLAKSIIRLSSMKFSVQLCSLIMLLNTKMVISMFYSNLAHRLFQCREANNIQFNIWKCFNFGISHKTLRYFKRDWRSHDLITLKACEDTLMFLGNWI